MSMGASIRAHTHILSRRQTKEVKRRNGLSTGSKTSNHVKLINSANNRKTTFLVTARRLDCLTVFVLTELVFTGFDACTFYAKAILSFCRCFCLQFSQNRNDSGISTSSTEHVTASQCYFLHGQREKKSGKMSQEKETRQIPLPSERMFFSRLSFLFAAIIGKVFNLIVLLVASFM